MLELLEDAAARGATLVVFPELAFTTFFPRWLIEGDALDHYFERGMPNPAVQPLFDRARALRIGFYVGYAELNSGRPALQRFNTGRSRRRNSWALSQGAFAGLGRAACRRSLPAARKALFRVWRPGIPRLPAATGLVPRNHGHDDLQRSPLAGSMARAGPAGRRTGLRRLQFRRLRSKWRYFRRRGAAHLPFQAGDAGQRLHERHAGRSRSPRRGTRMAPD